MGLLDEFPGGTRAPSPFGSTLWRGCRGAQPRWTDHPIRSTVAALSERAARHVDLSISSAYGPMR